VPDFHLPEKDDPMSDNTNPRRIPDTGSYIPFAVMDDGESLCSRCVADETNPVHVGGDADGWRIEGWSHSGEVDGTEERCAHCNRVIVDAVEIDLVDADTSEIIRRATADEVDASEAAARKDGGAGIFVLDGRRVFTR
jgi:hypothetical protein